MSNRAIGSQYHGVLKSDMAQAYYACMGAPASIQPGAVVAMYEQLEAAKRLQEEHYGDATGLHLAMIDWAEDAHHALAMYNGEDV